VTPSSFARRTMSSRFDFRFFVFRVRQTIYEYTYAIYGALSTFYFIR